MQNKGQEEAATAEQHSSAAGGLPHSRCLTHLWPASSPLFSRVTRLPAPPDPQEPAPSSAKAHPKQVLLGGGRHAPLPHTAASSGGRVPTF